MVIVMQFIHLYNLTHSVTVRTCLTQNMKIGSRVLLKNHMTELFNICFSVIDVALMS